MSETTLPYANPAQNGPRQRIEGVACDNEHCDVFEMLRMGFLETCPVCGHPLKVAVVEMVPYSARLRWV